MFRVERVWRNVGRIRIRIPVLIAVAFVPVGLSGCASWYAHLAELEGNRIRDEKLSEVAAFRRERLIDPRELAGSSRSKRVAPVELPPVVTLKEAIRIASEHNRDYQTERETLFIRALELGLVRRDFLRPVFSGSIAYEGSDRRRRQYSDVTSLSLGGSQIFRTGGTVSVDAGALIARDPNVSGPEQSSSTEIGVSVRQPLLRGAGGEVSFEQLTRTERELLYDARAFELFRQDFVVSTIDDYYGLVVQKKQLENTRARIVQQRRAVEQAEALFLAGRGSKLDSFRAEQSLLRAQSTALAAEQTFRFAFDRFKIRLGLPIDVDFDIVDEVPEPEPIDIDVERALPAALHNRLDLATVRDRVEDRERAVRIARNSLLPDLTVGVSYGLESEVDSSFRGLRHDADNPLGVSAVLEIPLDRRAERNDYRVALIQRTQSRRELERAEDDVITEVRDAIRRLERSREQIELGVREIASFEQSVEKAQIDLEAGRITNRDLVEARDDLTNALNDQLERKAQYEISRLELLRVVGILFVDEEGEVRR
ncbi:MAG: TolC family protein [Planctomycetes bacterium]|nr:TolC family protein [Planctomycetota bacterium]